MNKKLLIVAVTSAFAQFAVQRGYVLGLPLAAVVDKVDAVPEGQRGWYVEKEGKFHLDPTKIEIEDTTALKSALEKERNANKEASKKLREQADLYKDIDPVKYTALMKQLDANEEGSLIKDGKIDEVWNRRSERMKSEHEKQLKVESEKTNGAMEIAKTYMDRVLDNNIRAAATKAGLHPHAVEDALFRARSIFSLNEEGDAVQYDEDGKTIIVGKNGKDPFSPDEWLEGMKEKAPHWFPAGNGGGGSGGNRDANANGGKTIKRGAFDALSEAEKAAKMKDKFQVVD